MWACMGAAGCELTGELWCCGAQLEVRSEYWSPCRLSHQALCVEAAYGRLCMQEQWLQITAPGLQQEVA